MYANIIVRGSHGKLEIVAGVVAPDITVDSSEGNERTSPSLKKLCDKYDVGNEAKASNMIITVKRCFRRVLEDRLRRFVRNDSEIEDEFDELLGIIAKGGAG